LAALLAWKGWVVEQAPTLPIEQVRVGQRVIVDAPEEALATDIARLAGREVGWDAGDGSLQVEGLLDPLRELTSESSIEEITRADYRLVKLRAEERWPDGTIDDIHVETLQTWQWIQAHEVHVGGTVPLPMDLEEMGMDGDIVCDVLDILPCPPIEAGRGRVVLTTINHLNPDVRELTLRDAAGQEETLRPTAVHKFYSLSRGEWLAAADLQAGERLDGLDGIVTITSITQVPGTHRVYNFTVQGEHLYRVGGSGVLVHNTCAGLHHFVLRSLGSRVRYGHSVLKH